MTVDVQKVKELRGKTGLSIIKCKTALTEAKGDIPKAIEHLKRQGIISAEKKVGKATTAGRIGSYIHTNNKIGVLLEISSETDFVTNNEEFQEFFKDICLQITAMSPEVVSRDQIAPEVLDKERNIYRESIKDKPSQIVDKIVEGKLEKFFYCQKCLLDQPFIKDDSIKIKDFIKSKIAKFGENITVKRFVRFEIGHYE